MTLDLKYLLFPPPHHQDFTISSWSHVTPDPGTPGLGAAPLEWVGREVGEKDRWCGEVMEAMLRDVPRGSLSS